MLPAKFVERVLRELGPDEGGALCRALTGEPSVSVRLNAAKGLAAPSGRPIGWSSGGYWLDARPSFTLDPDFHAGRYYVQVASSQFVFPPGAAHKSSTRPPPIPPHVATI